MLKKLPKWVKTLLVVVVLVAGAKVAWGIAYPSGTWRYKLTVEVETPEGIKTGSAVREVKGRYVPQLLGASNVLNIGMTRGEAVVIDLGKYGTAFALNRTYRQEGAGAWTIVEFAFPQPHLNQADKIRYYRSLETTPTDLETIDYPVFVRFRDPADPKTVEALKPDDFAASFGPGVALKSVTIEMTREPVTTGVVERYLPWLPQYRNKMFDGQRYNTANSEYPFANSLAAGAFKAGNYK